MQQGRDSPLWEGTGEGFYSARNVEALSKKAGEKPDSNWNRRAIREAVSTAVDQCLTKSGLLEARERTDERK